MWAPSSCRRRVYAYNMISRARDIYVSCYYGRFNTTMIYHHCWRTPDEKQTRSHGRTRSVYAADETIENRTRAFSARRHSNPLWKQLFFRVRAAADLDESPIVTVVCYASVRPRRRRRKRAPRSSSRGKSAGRRRYCAADDLGRARTREKS